VSAHDLLQRLEAVRQRAPGSWSARCPAHDDRDPSLSVRETEDGTVLLKCFSGCSALDVVHAVGMELRDLFPPRLPEAHHGRPARRPRVDGWHVLEVLRHHLGVLRLAAGDLARGERLSDPDLASVREALAYIHWVVGEAQA
jgi:hypothetical protein